MIIDAHTHIDDVTDSGLSKEKRLQLLLKDMESNKIDHAFVLADIPSGSEGKFMSHEEILDLIKPHPQLHLVGKVPLNLCQDSLYLNQIKVDVMTKKIIGIKIYPGYENFYPHDKRYEKLFNICEEFDIPLMVHTGDVMGGGNLKYAHPLHVDELATKRPKLKIIICHMGNPWQLDTAAVTYKNENVYADTAGLFYKQIDPGMLKFLRKKIEEFVEWNAKGEKLIFGTDWPITSMKDTINLVNDPIFSKEEKELIFYKNAKKLFNLK